MSTGLGSCSMVDPIAWEPWDLPGGEWERLLSGTHHNVPSTEGEKMSTVGDCTHCK